MSSNYLHLIPIDHNYIPSPEQIQQAIFLISAHPLEAEPEIVVSEKVEFIDSRTGLTAIYCPRCGSKVEWGWWHGAMNRAYATGFRDLSIKTPCCNLDTNLNELRYDWPSGFARFRISFLNPGRDLEPEVIELIANALGTPIRKIWAHH